MPLFAAHVASSLVYIKLKLLPSGGENSIISVQLEVIPLESQGNKKNKPWEINIVWMCVCVNVYMCRLIIYNQVQKFPQKIPLYSWRFYISCILFIYLFMGSTFYGRDYHYLLLQKHLN